MLFIELVSNVFLNAKLSSAKNEARGATRKLLVHHKFENVLLQYKSFPLMRKKVQTLHRDHASLRCGDAGRKRLDGLGNRFDGFVRR